MPGSRSGLDSFSELLRILREDLRRQGNNATRPGFQALAVQRVQSWIAVRRMAGGALRPLLDVAFLVLEIFRVLVVRNVYGIELHYGSHIGRRTMFAHQNGITVHHFASIGDDCAIHQNVTIGRGARVRRGAAQIGNRVELSPGAVLVGAITVGDDAVVGPNSLVMTNVPAGSHVITPPGRIMQLRRPAATEAAEGNGT